MSPKHPPIPAVRGSDQSRTLKAGTYAGDLVIVGNDNSVNGAGAGVTVISGGLLIDGNDNRVTGLTVRGQRRVSGEYNSTDGVEFTDDAPSPRAAGVPKGGLGLIVGVIIASVAAVVIAAVVLPKAFAPKPSDPSKSISSSPSPPSPPSWASQIKQTANPLFAMAQKFVDDLRDGRYESAYGAMSKLYRDAVPLAKFRESVTTHPYLKAATSARVSRLSQRGGSGQGTGTLTTTAGEIDVTFHYAMEGGRWTISGVTIAGNPALPLTSGK